jgi:proteasome lid subunit RPN8/RPN11
MGTHIKNPQKVIISSKAYAAMIAETYTHPENETGGIFLGTRNEGVWYIFELIDPGYQRVVRERAYFEYDHVYVTHLAHVFHRIYRQPIEIIGLWHRHPGSLDTFSSTDDVTNRRFADMREAGAISAIVNLDPDFRITFYHVSQRLEYTSLDQVVVGDRQMPAGLMGLKRKEELTQRRKKVVSIETDHERAGFLGRWFSKSKEKTADIDIPFSMVEEEMDAYLDVQVDYSYEIRPRGNTLLVSLEYQGRMVEYPHRIDAVFFVKDGKRFCEINQIELPYSRGILKEYIFQAIAVYQEEQAAEQGPEEEACERPHEGTSETVSEDAREAYTEESSQDYEEGRAETGIEWACGVLEIDLTELDHQDRQMGMRRVRKARLKMMKDYHPDNYAAEGNDLLNKRANEETARINQAYEVVVGYLRGSGARRRAYER